MVLLRQVAMVVVFLASLFQHVFQDGEDVFRCLLAAGWSPVAHNLWRSLLQIIDDAS